LYGGIVQPVGVPVKGRHPDYTRSKHTFKQGSCRGSSGQRLPTLRVADVVDAFGGTARTGAACWERMTSFLVTVESPRSSGQLEPRVGEGEKVRLEHSRSTTRTCTAQPTLTPMETNSGNPVRSNKRANGAEEAENTRNVRPRREESRGDGDNEDVGVEMTKGIGVLLESESLPLFPPGHQGGMANYVEAKISQLEKWQKFCGEWGVCG